MLPRACSIPTLALVLALAGCHTGITVQLRPDGSALARSASPSCPTVRVLDAAARSHYGLLSTDVRLTTSGQQDGTTYTLREASISPDRFSYELYRVAVPDPGSEWDREVELEGVSVVPGEAVEFRIGFSTVYRGDEETKRWPQIRRLYVRERPELTLRWEAADGGACESKVTLIPRS